MRVILVGNSENVLNEKRGTEIDQFDKVIRINCARVQGFTEFIGSKTTNLFLTSTPSDQRAWVDKMMPNKDKEYEISRRQYADLDYITGYLETMGNVITYSRYSFEAQFGYSRDSFQNVLEFGDPFDLNHNIVLDKPFLEKYKFEKGKSPDYLNSYLKKFDLEWKEPNHYISSGLFLILILSHYLDEFFIHGMYDGGTSHYWDNEFSCWTGHNINTETEYVNHIISRSNIKRL